MSEADVPQQRPSWWSRNWKWVVPVGCLTPVVLCGGFIAVIVFVVFGALKSVEPYSESLDRAQNSAAVKAALGEPVEAGMFVTGNVRVSGNSGDANLAIPISGPKGSATIQVVATKQGGEWKYSKMEVVPADGSARIDLRKNGKK